jgi:hypothetical protein
MAQLSEAVKILYGVFFEEMRFAKKQQWTVTNYLLVLLGALLGVGITLKAFTITNFEKHALAVLVVCVVAAGWYFLVDLQRYLKKLRVRIQDIEDTFDDDDKKLLRVEKYESPGLRGMPFTVMMITAITIAGLVLLWVVWRL